MEEGLIYTPVIRLRQEELKVINSFNFGSNIFPLLEVIKEQDRKPATTRKGKPIVPKDAKPFEKIYLPIIAAIKSKKVFVDLPVHMNDNKKVNPDVIEFLKKVVANRVERTKYMKKFHTYSDKVIPVISTYWQRTGEINSISIQERDLRQSFDVLAFRTFPKTFSSDMRQIETIVKADDYLMVDLLDYDADPFDDDLSAIVEKLKAFDKCHIIILKAAMDDKITNVSLDHDKVLTRADNSLLRNFPLFNADSFGDYAGIKKDNVSKGGTVSPGFVYYNAVSNNYYGFKGKPRATIPEKFMEYALTIVPAVMQSIATKQMLKPDLKFLNGENAGWQFLLDIFQGRHNGKSPHFSKELQWSIIYIVSGLLLTTVTSIKN